MKTNLAKVRFSLKHFVQKYISFEKHEIVLGTLNCNFPKISDLSENFSQPRPSPSQELELPEQFLSYFLTD